MFYKKCLDQVWSPLLNVSSFWQWNWQILLEPGPSLSPSCPGCVSWGKALPPLSLFTLKQEDLLLPMPLSFLSEQWLLHNTGMLAMSATWWLKRVWMDVLSELRHTDAMPGMKSPPQFKRRLWGGISHVLKSPRPAAAGKVPVAVRGGFQVTKREAFTVLLNSFLMVSLLYKLIAFFLQNSGSLHIPSRRH